MDGLKLYLGYFGRGNLGDDLMLYCLTNKTPKSSHVILQGKNYYDFIPRENQKYFGKKHPIIILIFELIFIFKLKFNGLRTIVFGGGTQFSETSTLFTKIKQLCVILLCKILFVRVCAESIGIGRIDNKLSLLSLILKLIDDISVRDHTSSKKLYLINKIHKLKKDLVYDIKFKTNPGNKNKILITGTGSILKNNKNYLKNYIKFIKKNIDKKSFELIFCVFQKGEDEFLFKQLKNIFPTLKISTLSIDINEISKIYSTAVFVVGMRYHSLILADIFNVPFSGFSYDDKVKDLCYIKNMSFHKA